MIDKEKQQAFWKETRETVIFVVIAVIIIRFLIILTAMITMVNYLGVINPQRQKDSQQAQKISDIKAI